jgi:hypothetical protein
MVCHGLRGLLPSSRICLLFCVVVFFCRPIANPRRSSSHCDSDVGIEYAHSVGLGRSTAGDLLDAELVELGLQLLELLGEVLLVLAPELTSLDLGRLETVSACILSDSERKHTMVACCVCWVVGVENEDVLVGSNCGCGTRAKRVGRTKRARDENSKII